MSASRQPGEPCQKSAMDMPTDTLPDNRIRAEIAKLMAETAKLNAEAAKSSRERWWYPVALAVAASGATAAIIKVFAG